MRTSGLIFIFRGKNSVMTNFNWTRFSVAINIMAPAETEVKPGDTYRWLWHGWPDESGENGMIIDANGSDFMRFSFGKAGICSVHINPYENEYIVHLTQEEIPDTEEGRQNWHIGCKTGWTFYLANLKSVLEGGIDLRNKDVSMQELLNK
jgi:hypothetical protein